MKELVKDWIQFCEEKKSFNTGYFYSLFMDNLSQDELVYIYNFFPNSERLILKLKKYMLQDFNISINPEVKIELLEIMIRLDFEDRKKVFEEMNKISFYDKIAFKYIEDSKEIINLQYNDVLSQEFHDYINYKTILEDDKTDALYEALYGLTTDFDYRLYLFEPLLKVDYTGENLFQFKRLGGVYTIQDNTVLYSYK